MKFFKGQRVICIANKKDWDSVINDFDLNLMIALNSNLLPDKDGIYIIDTPMILHYKGKCYITLINMDLIYDESAFVSLEDMSEEEYISDKRILTFNN